MKNYIVNIPVRYIYYIEAENEQEALFKTQISTPDDVQPIDGMEPTIEDDKMEEMFAEDNPGFSREKFRKAIY